VLDVKVNKKKTAQKVEFKTISFNEIKESKVVFSFKNKK